MVIKMMSWKPKSRTTFFQGSSAIC